MTSLKKQAAKIEAEWYANPRPSPPHALVWQNLDDPDMPSLECRCGRRFVSVRAFDDLDAHLAARLNRAKDTEDAGR